MMWLGGSWRSWMMYSPRSVSIGAMPSASRWSLRPISSDTIDFDLATVRAFMLRQRSVMMLPGIGGGRRPMDVAAQASDLALELFQVEVEVAPGCGS